MKKLTVVLLFITVVLTWGTTWLAMRIAAETIPPMFATGMRFMFAAPFLIGIAWFRKTPLLFPPGQRFFQMVVCVFYFAIPFSLMIYGETYVSSGLASIIFANMPIAVLIASCLILNARTNILQLTGLMVSIAALSGILLIESKSSATSAWQGILALVTAVVIHAIVYAQCKKRSCSVSVITFNALPCLFAGLILAVVGGVTEKPELSTFSSVSVLSCLYLGAFAGVFGILCYFSLQQRATAFQASLVFLIFPLIAVSLENYTYGYAISSRSMLLVLPLIVGILITLISGNRSAASDIGRKATRSDQYV